MSFAVVIEGMTIAAFAILIAGGKQRRESGWGTLAILTSIAAAVQLIGMALIVRDYAALKELADINRLTCSRMRRTGFLMGSIWTRAGRCAQYLGSLRSSVQLRLLWRRSFCLLKVATS